MILGGGRPDVKAIRYGKVPKFVTLRTKTCPQTSNFGTKQEMPGYQKLLDRYRPQGFVVVGFKFDTMMDTEDPLEFAKKIGVRYPLAVATDDLKQKFGGIEGLPTTMLYDRDGILRQKVVGFEYTDTFEGYLKPLL